MSKPLKLTENAFCWYCLMSGESGVTYDGAARLTDHYLSPAVFGRLSGGELAPLMGIRKYASAADALADLRRAESR